MPRHATSRHVTPRHATSRHVADPLLPVRVKALEAVALEKAENDVRAARLAKAYENLQVSHATSLPRHATSPTPRAHENLQAQHERLKAQRDESMVAALQQPVMRTRSSLTLGQGGQGGRGSRGGESVAGATAGAKKAVLERRNTMQTMNRGAASPTMLGKQAKRSNSSVALNLVVAEGGDEKGGDSHSELASPLSHAESVRLVSTPSSLNLDSFAEGEREEGV